jgi:hypothetical protein
LPDWKRSPSGSRVGPSEPRSRSCASSTPRKPGRSGRALRAGARAR